MYLNRTLVIFGVVCTEYSLSTLYSMWHTHISLIFNESSHFDFGFYCFSIWRWFTQFWYDRWEIFFIHREFVGADGVQKAGAPQLMCSSIIQFIGAKWPLSWYRNVMRSHHKWIALTCVPFYLNFCVEWFFADEVIRFSSLILFFSEKEWIF